jgi:acetyl esterase
VLADGDPHVERLIRMLEAGRESVAVYDPLARRRGLEQLAVMAGSIGAPPCQTEEVSLDGVLKVRIYRPLASSLPQPGLVFFHGGGFVTGSLDTHDSVCRRLALGSRRIVIAVSYRLTPEAAYPAAHEDALAAVQAIARNASALGIDPRQLALAGDSVGGNLAMTACLALAPSHDVRIDRLGLMCPILDLERTSPSRTRYATGHFVDMDAVRRDFELYCQDPAIRAGSVASPLRAPDLSALPPTVIHTAERDPFLDDGEDLAARLLTLGREGVHVRHERMIHYFYALPGLIPAAETALDQFAQAMG